MLGRKLHSGTFKTKESGWTGQVGLDWTSRAGLDKSGWTGQVWLDWTSRAGLVQDPLF